MTGCSTCSPREVADAVVGVPSRGLNHQQVQPLALHHGVEIAAALEIHHSRPDIAEVGGEAHGGLQGVLDISESEPVDGGLEIAQERVPGSLTSGNRVAERHHVGGVGRDRVAGRIECRGRGLDDGLGAARQVGVAQFADFLFHGQPQGRGLKTHFHACVPPLPARQRRREPQCLMIGGPWMKRSRGFNLRYDA
jgi:hypothetical protein